MSNKKRISKEKEDEIFYGKKRAEEAQAEYERRKQDAQQKMRQRQKEAQEIRNEIENKKFSKEKEIEHKKTLVRKKTSIKNPRNNFIPPRINSNQRAIFNHIDKGGNFKIIKGGKGKHTNNSKTASFGSSKGHKGKAFATSKIYLKSGAGMGRNNIKNYIRDVYHILRMKYILKEKLDNESLKILNDFKLLYKMSDNDINDLLNSNNVSNNLENVVLGLSDINYEREYLSGIDFYERINNLSEQVKNEYDTISKEIARVRKDLSQDAVNKIIFTLVDDDIENDLCKKYESEMAELNVFNIDDFLRSLKELNGDNEYSEMIEQIEIKRSKQRPIKSKNVLGNVEREQLFSKYKNALENNIKKNNIDKSKKLESKVEYLKKAANKKGVFSLIEPFVNDIDEKILRLRELNERKKEKQEKFKDILNMNKGPKRDDYFEQIVILSVDHYEKLEKEYGAEIARELHVERLEEYMERVSEQYGVEKGAFALHLDEGHICPETGKFSRNIHAHLTYYNYDFKNNVIPSLEMNRKYKREVSFEEHNREQNQLLSAGFGKNRINYNMAGVQLFKEKLQDILNEELFDELGYVRPLANKYKENYNNDRQYDMKMKAVKDREKNNDRQYEIKMKEIEEKKEKVKKQLKQEQERKNAELEKEKERIQEYQDQMEELYQQDREKINAEKNRFKESVKSQIEKINKDMQAQEDSINEKIQAEKDNIEKQKEEIKEIKSNYSAVDEAIEDLSGFFRESFGKMVAFPRQYKEINSKYFNECLLKYESMKMLGIQSNKIELELSKIMKNAQQMTSVDRRQMKEQSPNLYPVLIGENANNRFKNIIKR